MKSKLDRIHEIDSEHETIFQNNLDSKSQNDDAIPSPTDFIKKHTSSLSVGKTIETNFLANSEFIPGQ